MKQGVLHMHSRYSYDGHNSIEEIADWARGEGLDFVILTEHDNDFDKVKFQRYQDACKRNSQGLTILPGIEYSFGKKREVHINVFGINELIETEHSLEDIPLFLKKVHSLHGFSVLNHPKGILKEVSLLDLTYLSGIELWNTKSDFHYAPDPRLVRFISTQQRDKRIMATSDLHSIPSGVYAKIVVKSQSSSVGDLVGAFKKGAYHCVFGSRKVPAAITNFQWNNALLWSAGIHERAYKIVRRGSRSLGIRPHPKLVKRLKLK